MVEDSPCFRAGAMLQAGRMPIVIPIGLLNFFQRIPCQVPRSPISPPPTQPDARMAELVDALD